MVVKATRLALRAQIVVFTQRAFKADTGDWLHRTPVALRRVGPVRIAHCVV